jgi:hypothetical protein
MIDEENRMKIYAAFCRKVAEVGRTEAYQHARKAVKPWAAYSTVVGIVKRMEAEEAARKRNE